MVSAGAETNIFQRNYINTMADDDLATQGTRSSAAMVLIMYDKQVLVPHLEGFVCLCHLCQEMKENANTFLCFFK